MPNKFLPFKLNKIFKPVGKMLTSLCLLPAAALLLKKHAEINSGGRKEYLYTFGKKGNPASAALITNQTPSKLAKKAVRGCMKK